MCHRGSRGISHITDAVNLHLYTRDQTPTRAFDVPRGSFSQPSCCRSGFLGGLSRPGQSAAEFGPCQFRMTPFPLTFLTFIKKLLLLAPQICLLSSLTELFTGETDEIRPALIYFCGSDEDSVLNFPSKDSVASPFSVPLV